MARFRGAEVRSEALTTGSPFALPGGFAIPEWTEQALCAQTDPEMFFPEKGAATRPAKRICGLCPVTAECLAYSLEHAEAFGVWGGKSEQERRRMPGYNPDGRITPHREVTPEARAAMRDNLDRIRTTGAA